MKLVINFMIGIYVLHSDSSYDVDILLHGFCRIKLNFCFNQDGNSRVHIARQKNFVREGFSRPFI